MHFHPTPEGSVGIPALNIVKPKNAWNIIVSRSQY